MKLLLSAFIFTLLFSLPLQAESRSGALKRAEREIRNGNFALAEDAYRQLLNKNPDDKDARNGLSLSLLKQYKLQECFEEAAQVVATDPLNGRAFSLMGTALLKSGEFRSSFESLKTAVQLNNKDPMAIAGLAEIEFFEHRTNNAYDLMSKAIEMDSREPDNYVTLARICSRLELYGEAANAYQNFLAIAPRTDEERRARILGLISFYRYLGSTKLHKLSGPEKVVIPIEVYGNRPFINIRVNGKDTLRFVVDTGASLSVISDRAAAKLGMKAVAKGGMARAVGGTGSFPIIYGIMDSMELGDAKIDLVPTYIRTVHISSETPEAERADGYIGLSVLANYGVTIDYKSRTMTLDRSPIAPPEAIPDGPLVDMTGISIPLRSTSGGLASAEGLLEGHDKPFNFIIDTGASSTVISKAAVKRHGLENLKLKDAVFQVVGAAGIETDVEAVGLATLTVNGLRKRNARALILNLDPVNETSGFEQHGILGGDFLRHFRVLIDLRRYECRLLPQSDGIEKIASK